jgi:large subunit ribosomal protein L21
LVQSLAVPKPDGSLSAVVVSGGKQYRVAPGDEILVDRLDAEAGSSLKLGRVLLFSNDGEIKVGAPGVDGVDVEVKVLGHRRGPRLESLRYKSKKRVRVHHGGRADLTALQIIAVGGLKGKTAGEGEKDEAPEKSKPRSKAKARPVAKAEAKEAAQVASPAGGTETEAPAKPARRTRKAKERA